MALAPPAEKDGFSYAGDALYREASNHNRHRRATLPELKAHFTGKDAASDRPAHWYEAQLLHYGLPPSKTKGTAHKRLFDAVMMKQGGGGGLAVPAHILKIEAELKKEWTKREREAKKVLKESAVKAPAKGTKRKADMGMAATTSVSVNVQVQFSSSGQVIVQAAQPPSKKAKTAAVAKDKKAPAPQSERKIAVPKSKTTTAPKAPKATFKAPAKPKTTPQSTARAPFASNPGSRAPSFTTGGPSFHADEAPPPYSEFDYSAPAGPSSYNTQSYHHSSSPPTSSQPRIGLLNGRYSVSCAQYPDRADDMGLIATLDGKNLWLSFDFGIIEGMIKLARPQEADAERPTAAYWRGRSVEDGMLRNVDTAHRVGAANYVYFMGGGHIRGVLQSAHPGRQGVMELEFDAWREEGQSMTSEVSPTEARARWAGLDEYGGD